jgi:hypothetical protein
MTSRKHEGSTGDKPPQPRQIPETTPTRYAGAVNEMWLAETVMQMQKSIGELTSSVAHLETTSADQSTKIDKISHRMYAAGVVITVLMGLGGFFLSKIWDGVFTLLKAAH